ncbi:hypothetical protein [Cellulomonas shaoxiangyii]|uniref:Uncharacterized protein n=1 Tax=Cellulomonas shaoxiangyii TaxID=2566013 RepID=A0A4P7SHX9_9CELL|nr:hypothetical protein [Cellulomonas shaoxiangyii]QCB93331.1 hypothetical protein E5225_06965 [Cellulomonas shaoxiangyii]TGY79436.1 hypothetical protein E5226_15495 [Cellulomonas shaoxiangyii]
MTPLDLTEAVEAAHVFTSSSRVRGGGLMENFAACTCGHPLGWEGRAEAHRRHVLTELVQAVREQVAREIEVEMWRHDRAQVGFSAIGDAYADAARIARGGTQ